MKCLRLAASHVQSACLFFFTSCFCFYIAVMSEISLLFPCTLLDKVRSIKLWLTPFRVIPDKAYSLWSGTLPTEMTLKDDVK